MGDVYAHMTMSLDGFIADTDDAPRELFDWYSAGDVAMSSANDDISFAVDPASAQVLRRSMDGTGALLCGRRLFDITNGWGDNHPVGAPVVVVTHHPPDDTSAWPRTTFVGDVATGVATAKQIAGDRDVVVSSASIAAQALDLGLLDAVHISLAPVLLGRGIPYFAGLVNGPHVLGDPTIVAGTRVTHLSYPVRH